MEHATMCHPTYKTCSHKAHEELHCLKQTMRWKKLLSMIKQSVILPLAGNILCMVFKIQKKSCGIAARGATRTFGEGLRRSTVAHFARKVRGGEYCGGQARAKNPTKLCPRALVIFATCSWPSLCKQSELQCWRRRFRYKVPPPSGESYAGYSALKGWMFKIPKKLCAVLNQIAWRLRCCP